jgi:methylmalonyl-CoA mutase cobalamin-binding domain/chain
MAAETVPKDISDRLGRALVEGDPDATVSFTEEALAGGVDPLALIQQVVVPTLTEVGQRFEELEIFLPELMAAGEAGNACSRVIEEALLEGGGRLQSEGVVVIGTVTGDIHDIGKNIVGSLFKAHGYKVVDLGKNVSAAAFVEAADANKADVIAASALMSITRAGCREVADLLRELGLEDKYVYIVGGGSIDQQYAEEIGADGYSATASGGVEVARSLLAGRRGA